MKGSGMLTGEGLTINKPFPKLHPDRKQRSQAVDSRAAALLAGTVKFPGLDPSIRDSDEDWLTRQLREEAEAQVRICDMFGISPHVSDAAALKAEHAIRHAAEAAVQAYRR